MIGDMYGDFSRMTFAPEKHYSSVLIQQGRVMVDADANEQSAILLHNLRRFIVDAVGPYGGPAGKDANFAIYRRPNPLGTNLVLTIGAGRYYVNGLLCQSDAATPYYRQPDSFLNSELETDKLPEPPFMIYMRAWERHITAHQDPSIREQALGDNGPDTAARSKVVWQVRAAADFPPGSGHKVSEWAARDLPTARAKWNEWAKGLGDGGHACRMRARARSKSSAPLEPTLASPEASFRGLENQLYRIEIHTGGTAGTAMFKWSRENGAAVFPIESLSGADATVATLGRDAGLGLAPNDWVEIVDDRSVLRDERHPLIRVASVDPLERLVVLETSPEGSVGHDPARHPLLRRWDHQGAAASGYPSLDPGTGALTVAEGGAEDGWLEIEDGVEVQFAPGGTYRSGEFWLIPARTAIEDVEWPQHGGVPDLRRPMGVDYSYAPLALADDGGHLLDMRSVFEPLAKPAA